MTTTRLPLFPLNTVLFPGLVMPLNVFEPRYRALTRSLLEIPEDEPRLFGVVAIRDGHEVAPTAVGLPGVATPSAGPAQGFGADPLSSFFSVGCVADASTIREREDGSGYDLLATGTSRFRLRSIDTGGEFLVAETEELPEEAGEGAGALAEGVLRAFRAYQKRLAGAHERTLAGSQELPDEPSVVSYLVAAAAVLDTVTKQGLLERPDTAARLAEELRLLRRETAVLGKLPSLPAVDLTRRPTCPN
ncbi:LON peptidase substrate-binding domain-containing protein [Streptomyces alkaliterrae]|uniref:ATP-dependent protease n=1 Tax=Streptomyces alkaliterrae TaxID=2213162 RepID=A0A5P0YLR4_9ACTN|nr:LON peptidase substrate-binding domain-containing protein [Streptomyces alkaliterrae]MBB1253926.1 LON peptidase substrate-binding domain-containing protein [Streptomyces alkaliterrae]MBB1260058.1 LON peptidase substrate-binding domain-containing protein [Streptomyces alkaliterrae]MQS01236.1 ATP-dependent protease [Streptomyces alkaliterrae]